MGIADIFKQVNAQLKAAIEFQSLEIARLRASVENQTGVLAQHGSEKENNADYKQVEEVTRLRDMIQSREREISLLREEKDRFERAEQRNRRELRRTKLSHARATHELDKVRSQRNIVMIISLASCASNNSELDSPAASVRWW
jgi:prophage tail gpP-like protein